MRVGARACSMLTLQSSYLNCAPSFSFRADIDPRTSNAGPYSEMPFIAALLVRGYTVTSADYESNELSAFTPGPSARSHSQLISRSPRRSGRA